MPERMLIVSGPSGSGKSTWCAELARQARRRGIEPRGVLSPGRFEAGRKVGIDIVDLASGEQRSLASPRTSASDGVLTDDWCFETESLEWANQLLGGIEGARLVILDELGPLELVRGQGLVEGLQLLDRREYEMAVAVIRPKHLSLARNRWPEAVVIHVADGPASPESVLGDLGDPHP